MHRSPQTSNLGSRLKEVTELVRASDRVEGGAMMRPPRVISCFVSILGMCTMVPRTASQAPTSGQRIVIAASVALDGKGRVLHNVRIVTEGSKIVAVGPGDGRVNYNLHGLTVLPGWIDAHVH